MAAEVYEPVHSPNELLLSIRYRAFDELEQLMHEVQHDCRRSSFAVVFSQLYYLGQSLPGRPARRTLGAKLA